MSKRKLKNKDLSKIGMLLNYNGFMSESRVKIILPFIGICVIMLFVIVSCIYWILHDQITKPKPTVEVVLIIVFGSLAISFLPILLLVTIIRNEKIRNRVNLWLEDAVEVEAFTKRIDTKYWLFSPLIQLQIEFYLDGVFYVRTSKSEHRSAFDFGRPVGYFAHITKYADRKVKILYSPKYDEVMIIKD